MSKFKTKGTASPALVDAALSPSGGLGPKILGIVWPKRTGTSRKAMRFIRDYVSFVLLAALLIVGAFVSPVFLTSNNLLNILAASSVLGIVALGQCVLILTKKFDMSVAYTVGLSGIVAIMVQNAGVALGLSFFIGILAGALVGLMNGIIVVTTKANPFLVTLGTSTLVYALSLTITQSRTFSSPYEGFFVLGTGRLWDTIHYSSLLFLSLAILLELIFRYTTIGRSLFVIGSNERVAHLSGTRVSRTVLLTFIASGMFAAIAGLVMASRNGSTVANSGVGMDFDSIIVVVLGGTSLFGGRGGAFRTVAGVLIFGVLNNLMVLLGFPAVAQQIVKGAVFLLVIAIDSALREDKR
jgi:ribose/xylose/arabinose/galactoside ABC-type transport system permease subunit